MLVSRHKQHFLFPPAHFMTSVVCWNLQLYATLPLFFSFLFYSFALTLTSQQRQASGYGSREKTSLPRSLWYFKDYNVCIELNLFLKKKKKKPTFFPLQKAELLVLWQGYYESSEADPVRAVLKLLSWNSRNSVWRCRTIFTHFLSESVPLPNPISDLNQSWFLKWPGQFWPSR